MAGGPDRDAHADLIARARPPGVLRCDDHVTKEPRIIGNDVAHVAVPEKGADDLRPCAPNDRHDLGVGTRRFRPARMAAPLSDARHAHRHQVAVEGRTHVLGGNVDILSFRFTRGPNESEPPRIAKQRADHEARLRRVGQVPLLHFDELAGGLKFLDGAEEFLEFLRRHVQGIGHFLRGHRTVVAAVNERNDACHTNRRLSFPHALLSRHGPRGVASCSGRTPCTAGRSGCRG